MDWLKREAKERGCVQLQLDSGVQREQTHRFYFRGRLGRSIATTSGSICRKRRLLQERLQIQIANQPVDVVWVQPEQPRGRAIAATRAIERFHDQVLLGLCDRGMEVEAGAARHRPSGRRGRGGGRPRSGDEISVEPSTIARSIAFSSSRTFPGQS